MTPFETLVALRAHYGAFPSPADKGELLNRLAWTYRATGMALLGKPAGNNVPTPSGALVSSDFLVHVPSQTGHDVLTGNDQRDAIPVAFEWGPGPEPLADLLASGARTIVLPTDPGGVVVGPGPSPAPGGTDFALLEPRVVRLEALLEEMVKQIRLQNELQGMQGRDLAALLDRVTTLEAKAPAPAPKKPSWWPW